ncbi:MAG: hypothetical protein ACYTDX_07160 [Planctomycetota bacterium]|jgi:hypothetical protein
MSRRVVRRALLVAGIALAAALPFAGQAWRADADPRCSLDGVDANGPTTVRFEDHAREERLFCSVDCAEIWLSRTGEHPHRILVTDENSGVSLDAGLAWFVHGRIPSNTTADSFVHVFGRETDAREHIENFGGVLLTADQRPFATH